MSRKSLVRFLNQKLHPTPSGYPVVAIGMGLIVTVSLALLVWDLRQDYQLFGCTDVKRITCYIASAVSFRIPISFGLIVCAVGLWSKRLFSLIVSLFALVGTAEIYREWHAATLDDMKMFGAPTFADLMDQKQTLLPLYQANWWDVIVLGSVIFVFIWEALALFQMLRSWPSPRVISSTENP